MNIDTKAANVEILCLSCGAANVPEADTCSACGATGTAFVKAAVASPGGQSNKDAVSGSLPDVPKPARRPRTPSVPGAFSFEIPEQ